MHSSGMDVDGTQVNDRLIEVDALAGLGAERDLLPQLVLSATGVAVGTVRGHLGSSK